MPTTNAVSADLEFTGTITNGQGPACKAPARRNSFTNRFLDFWLLGGLSLAAFAYVFTQNVEYGTFLFVLPLLQLWIEFPHLMASYRLAYSRGSEFRRRHALVLFGAPVLLLAAALTLQWPTLVAVIFLTTGYHRARQVYGIMIVYSIFDGYKLERFQRRILNAMLLSVWIAGYLHMNAWPKPLYFFGVPIPMFTVPPWLLTAANWGFAAAVVVFLNGVVMLKFMRERRLPSLNFVVPLAALIVWFGSYIVSADFFLFMTPAFHALQYLACVAGYGREKRNWYGYLLSGGALVGAGFLIMRLVPQQIEPFLGFGVLGIYIFVSLHHYLLDSVIWRTSDPGIQRNLIGGRQ